MTTLNRRQFLQLAGVTSTVALPTLLGYDWLRASQGDMPPNLSPYTPSDVLETWPSHPAEASPLLLLVNNSSDNPFSLYLAEILRAEGLNCFQVADLSTLDSAPLDWYDVILLAEGPVNTWQMEQLESYVTRGGRLVAMRPDTRSVGLFGLERAAGSTTEGYLKVETSHPIGQGIAGETLQFHGTADHYRLAGAQAIAWLASNAETRTDWPALAFHRFGQGQVALWAFDLARSVAYMRQGNPDWSNQERDGLDGIRTTDLFAGWIDLDRMAIPQADEQQRLLANLLTAMSQSKRPLPRLWYFPGNAEGMLIATSDSHMIPADSIEAVLTRVERYGGHISIYFSPVLYDDGGRAIRRARFWETDHFPVLEGLLGLRFGAPTPALVTGWRARGHEFTVHPYVETSLRPNWECYWKEFTGRGYGPLSPTTRTHRTLWTGWVETARLQASYGIHMNLDFYQAGPLLQKKHGEWAYGHMTGSGLPMKFVDGQGRILSIYQQLTQLADDHMIDWQEMSVFGWSGWPKLSGEAAADVYREMLDRSLDGAYSAIAAQFHVDPFAVGGGAAVKASRFLEGTLTFAVERGIPIWSAQEWLRFTDLKHDADFRDVQWRSSGKQLSFRMAGRQDPTVSLTVMVPYLHEQGTLAQIEVDGIRVEHRARRVGGVSYGWISLPAGSHQIAATYS